MPDQCECVTERGNRCKLNIQKDSRSKYCYKHQGCKNKVNTGARVTSKKYRKTPSPRKRDYNISDIEERYFSPMRNLSVNSSINTPIRESVAGVLMKSPSPKRKRQPAKSKKRYSPNYTPSVLIKSPSPRRRRKGASPMFEKDELKNKACRLVLHVAKKNTPTCNVEKKWDNTKKCYNPYAIANKMGNGRQLVGRGNSCTTYDFREVPIHPERCNPDRIPDDEVAAWAQLQSVEFLTWLDMSHPESIPQLGRWRIDPRIVPKLKKDKTQLRNWVHEFYTTR